MYRMMIAAVAAVMLLSSSAKSQEIYGIDVLVARVDTPFTGIYEVAIDAAYVPPGGYVIARIAHPQTPNWYMVLVAKLEQDGLYHAKMGYALFPPLTLASNYKCFAEIRAADQRTVVANYGSAANPFLFSIGNLPASF